MSRIDLKSLFYGIGVCLLPIVVGIYYYNRLPNEFAIHFGANGVPDSFIEKSLGVVMLPILMAFIFSTISIVLDIQQKSGEKGVLFIKALIPILGAILQCSLLYYALDNGFDVPKMVVFVIGIVQIVLGNYLPKKELWGKYNFNLFGLEKRANEQKVIRAYAKFMVGSGVVIFVSIFLSTSASLLVIVIFALLAGVLPFYFAKKYKEV